MANIFSDNFNRADNATTLGANWIVNLGSVFGISANKAILNTTPITSIAKHANGGTGGNQIDYSTADYSVQALINTNFGFNSIVGRLNQANTLGYFARRDGGVDIELREVGSLLIGSATLASIPDPFTLKLEMIGSTIRVFVNDAPVISVVNTTAIAAGVGGIGKFFAAGGGGTVWDDFSVDDFTIPSFPDELLQSRRVISQP